MWSCRMGVREALILFGIISSTFATIISQQCWYDVYVLRQAQDVANVVANAGTSCLCHPQHGYEVSQAIKQPNSDLERVVVFYYRDKTNNDIYMFTPNNDKQVSIPELTFGKYDDLYKVNSDFSLRPFETSTITVSVDVQNPISNQYPHQKITNAQDKQLEKIDQSINAWNEQNNGPHVVTVDYPHPYEQIIEQNVETIDNTPVAVHDQKLEQNVLTVDYPNLLNQKIQQKVETVDDSPNAWHDQKQEVNVITIDSPISYNQKIQQKVETIDSSPNAQKQEQNVLTVDYPNLIEQILEETNVQPSSFNLASSSNTRGQNLVTIDYPDLLDQDIEQDVQPAINSLNPWLDQNLVTADITNLYDHKNPQILGTNVWYDSVVPEKTELDDELKVALHTIENDWIRPGSDFKTWFSQQTIQFPELSSVDSQHISVEELQSHLVNLLKRYGYSLINDQILNANREPVDFSQYKLIRVIIRAPDDEQHLTSKVIGVMLVNMSPLTILGVVPLRNTFDETSMQGWDNEKNILGKYTFAPHHVNVTKDLLNNENMTLENTTNGNRKSISLFANLGIARVSPSSKTVETTRRNSGEEVLPGFRIIGGNAATGSGTPITSKGRSASP
ncbi:uncharacterized protein LOC128678556 [Plodia interpunctella]|uniref:uncharacterized protein LOC128678556 n=1 Tax=Plodia interpunctella TaxID=58824 RepID=UPI002368E8BB|nr:uncharacterized protein LOC128678556 [Plodia interpunctella]